MDAIAFLMFAEPAAPPSPRSETPLPDAPFGALVAAAANNKEEDASDSTDGASDMAAAQAGLMSGIVSQWLAQRDSFPSLPPFARGILERRGPIIPEAPLSPDTGEEPALSSEDIPSTNAEEQTLEAVEPTSGDTKALTTMAGHGQIVFESASQDEVAAPVAPRVHAEELRLPFQQLMQHAADIGWSAPNSETKLASADLKISTTSEPIKDVVAELQAPDARASTTPSRTAIEPPIGAPAKRSAASEATIDDKAKEQLSPIELKASAADRPNVAKQHVAPHVGVHAAAESLHPPPITPSNAANTPSPAADNVSIPSPSNISAATENSTDIPVKLAVVTREGQTAEMQTLALHVAARWAKGESKFTIRLDPPELGRIDVNLNVNNHGHAQAVLAVEKPQTLDLLLRDAPSLERALKDAGLELGGNLSFSLKEDARQSFAQGDQYSPPSRTIELVPTDAPKPHVALNASLVEQLYGSRTARLDITV
jgi:flagellar hook-length control protein FliK